MSAEGIKVGVADFYIGRTVFVTGGTGFMGKVLVEKLLYGCPGLKKLYILMRPKREKSVETRLEEMFKSPMFNRLRQENPDALKKLEVLQGDMCLEELGLSKENQERLRLEVSVVFHCAATLRLEANLKDAVVQNTTGTWRVIELCRGMTKLVAFVHLSTAFCHVDEDTLEEKTYEAPNNPHDIIRCVEWMDDQALNELTARLIAPHPNTYTFTKRLSEKLIVDEYPQMPMAIARPAIVTPSHMEPMPGWVDSLNGPIGLTVAAGKGVIRSVHCNAHYRSEVIPVDMAINALIAIAWKTASVENRPPEVPVYNLTTSAVNDVTWGRVLDIGRQLIYKFPFEMTVWYPDGNLRTSKTMHTLCVIFLHFLPAYFIDFMMFVFRQKRFMVRLQWRIQDGLNVLEYFTTRQWDFPCKNFMGLRELMTKEDRKKFSMEVEEIEEVEYMLKSLLGARQYCLKEDLSSLPRCRRTMKILWVVDKLWTFFFYSMLVWMVYSYSETARHALDFVGDQLKGVPVLRDIIHKGDAPV